MVEGEIMYKTRLFISATFAGASVITAAASWVNPKAMTGAFLLAIIAFLIKPYYQDEE